MSTKRQISAAELDQAVDRVDRGAGHGVDDRALLAGQPVEQARLADVGPPDQRHPARAALGVGLAGRVGQRGEHRVEQVAAAAAVQAADRVRLAQPERPQLGGVGLDPFVVDLGDREHHRPLGAAQRPGDDQVGLGGAGAAVDHEQHEIGGGDGAFGLGRDHGLQPAGVRLPAAGVDQGEPPPAPQRVVGDAVAGHARDVLHDGFAAAEDAVDQRRLADVRPADDRHDGRNARFIDIGPGRLDGQVGAHPSVVPAAGPNTESSP